MPPPWRDMVQTFGRIGLLSFGGPAAQIALMHRELVDARGWLDEPRFLRALSFCMLLPGPEAMQLATYAGWRLRGVAGGMLAGGLFVGPGALVIAALALIYARTGAQPDTAALLLGVKAAVIVIVVQAMLRLSRKALGTPLLRGIAALSFVALYAFALPFPLVIALAAALGAWLLPVAAPPTAPIPAPPVAAQQWRTGAVWLALWLLPLPVLALTGQDLLLALARVFATLAVVTFGGAYAVLAYMAQTVVDTHGWLTPAQMVDALGLAETTPGPLILVTQFVGMLAGHQAGGMAMALAAGVVTLWMTFVPCFLWIFAGAPYIDTALTRPRLQAALGAITAAVMGVMVNLALFFAIHVLFERQVDVDFGPVALRLPDWSSLHLPTLALTALAAILMIGLRRGPLLTLVLCALAAWGWAQI